MATIIITAFLISTVAGMQAVEVAKANPVPYQSAPNTDLLVLHIDTPENYSTTYANNSLSLIFRVVEPPSWNSYKDQLGIFYEPIIGDFSVWVYLDGNLTFARQNEGTYNQLVYEYNVSFTNLTSEQYNATINVLATTFYTTNANYSRSTYETNMSQTALFKLYPDSKTILFSTNPVAITRDPYPFPSPSPSPSLTPTPTPTFTPTLSTSPTPTPSPTLTVTPIMTPSESPTQQPTIEPTPPIHSIPSQNYSILITIGIVAVIMAVAGALFYFKKRRG